MKAVNHYLELIAKDISTLFGHMCDEYVRLSVAVSYGSMSLNAGTAWFKASTVHFN